MHEESNPDVIEIELSADALSFVALEEALVEDELPGVSIRTASATDPVLRSSKWQSVIITITSAGGIKVFKDVLVAYLQSREVRLTLRKSGDRIALTVEGPIDDERVQSLVDQIVAK